MTQKLRSLIAECANPSGAKDSTRIQAGNAVKVKLRKMLKEIKDIGTRLDNE